LEARIPCPHCHSSLSLRFDQIGPDKALPCPSCGAVIRFSGQDLGGVEQAISQLTGRLENAGVKINIKTRVRHPSWKFWSR
jgi:hypothetical protein